MAKKASAVITTHRGAEVCQRCLVKWARTISPDKKFLCNRCFSVLEKTK